MSLNVRALTAPLKYWRRSLSTLALVLGLVFLSVAPVNVAPASAQTGGCSWNGLWDTGIYGQLLLTQSGRQVSGEYAYFQTGYGLIQGQVTGTLQGSTFTGTWTQSPSYIGQDSGTFALTVASNCSQFFGRWRYSTTPNGLWDSTWNGVYLPPTVGS